MRVLFSSLLVVALGACSSHPASSSPTDAGDVTSQDGNTVRCTSVGGTCAPINAPGCPIAQQNTELCEDVVLVCCLPAAGSAPPGVPPGDSVVDSGGGTVVDSGTVMDSGKAGGGMDAGADVGTSTPPVDASTQADSGDTLDGG
jgi:hypothetical protein